MSENDPARLDAFANEIVARYPIAAAALRVKASSLRPALPPPAPPRPVPQPGPVPAGNDALPASLVDIGDVPEPLRGAVIHALVYSTDPDELERLAGDIGDDQHPKAVLILMTKARLLRAARGAVQPPRPPSPMPVPSPIPVSPPPSASMSPLDVVRDIPEPVRAQVLQQLLTGADPDTLDAFGAQLAAMYPRAAAALHQKADLLRKELGFVRPAPAPTPIPVGPTPASAPPLPMPVPRTIDPPAPPYVAPTPVSPAPLPPIAPVPPAPVPHWPPPAPPAPSVPPSMPASVPVMGLDPGIPSDVASAVQNALITENDPAKLEGFASSLRASYPISAGLLSAKASSLRFLHPTPATPQPPTQPGIPPGVPSLPSGPPLPFPLPAPPSVPTVVHPPSAAVYPIGSDATRTGRNAGRPTGQYPFVVLGTTGPGNAPITIAKYGAGAEERFVDLKPLNPQYRFGVDAEFVGQALNVPWEWAPKLKAVGYVVQQDPGAMPNTMDAVRSAPPIARSLPKGDGHVAHP